MDIAVNNDISSLNFEQACFFCYCNIEGNVCVGGTRYIQKKDRYV